MSDMYINKSKPVRLWLSLPSPAVQEEQRQVVKSFGRQHQPTKAPSSLGPRLYIGESDE